MTQTEKYNALLEELGELLANKNSDIAVLRWQLDDALRKLKEAETEIAELKGKICERKIGVE